MATHSEKDLQSDIEAIRADIAALTDTVKGLYIPYWTFDAQVHADWTAESGYYYYETETYRDANGRTQTRQVQKVRWVPSAGALDHFFDKYIHGTDELPLPSLWRRAALTVASP